MTTITERDIEVQRQVVRQAYATFGFHSPQYQQGFDKLHDMNLAHMAASFRAARGLPPNAKTPYCPGR